MIFNKQQDKLWLTMISLIGDFRKGDIQYSALVYGLEGALDVGEFKNKTLVEQWYDYWTPLEILSATKGDNTTIEDADKYLSAMEMFLKSIPLTFNSLDQIEEE
jgi:hypothetical protein